GMLSTLAPGSYQVSALTLSGGELRVNNATGPVTLYVTGPVAISSGGRITTAAADPERFALYVSGAQPVAITNNGSWYGVLYAPQSVVSLGGNGGFFGSFVGSQ